MSQRRVEYQKFPGGAHCSFEGCRERKYTIQDGFQYCRRGHRQDDFTQQQIDEDDDFKTRVTGRTTRKARDLEAEKEARSRKILKGAKALEMHMHCLQVVLRKMIRGVEDKLGRDRSPEGGELEHAVLAIWNIRVRAVKHLEEARKSGVGSATESGSESGFYSSFSERGSGSDSDGNSSRSSSAVKKERYGAKSRNSSPRLVELLAFCYLGCVLLRLPLSLGDLYTWVDKGDIVFLQATRHIPQDMVARLPSHFTSALATKRRLKPDDLYPVVLEQVLAFRNGPNNLTFPPLNAPLIMYKHVVNLALPLEVYAGARNIAKVLGIDFAYPQLTRYRWSAHPEAQIIALVVIATKLSQSFDGVRRIPRNKDDPTTLTIDWQIWTEQFASKRTNGLMEGKEIDVVADDVLSMDAGQIDTYMDFFEDLFPVESELKMPAAILDLFPVHERSVKHKPPSDEASEIAVSKLAKVMSSLRYEKPVRDNAANDSPPHIRPGMQYVHYRSIEELSPTAKAFFERAACCAGLSLVTMREVVFQMEMRMNRYVTAIRQERRRAMLAELDIAEHENSLVDDEDNQHADAEVMEVDTPANAA